MSVFFMILTEMRRSSKLRRLDIKDDFDGEIELTRRNKKLMAWLERRARQAKTISLEDAKARLGLVN